MAVLRKHKKSNYTVIDNEVFDNHELSLKAKGLLCQMLHLPDDWDFNIIGLAKQCKDGKDSVMSALKELEEAGYLRRERVKEEGKFAGYDYIVSETRMSDSPYTGNPNTGNPNTENPPLLNTNIPNTNLLNTEDIYNSAPRKKRKSSDLHNDPSKRPSLEEIEDYIGERGLRVDGQMFYNYFDASEWIDSLGNPVKNWKQKLITWSKNNDDRGSYGNRSGLRGTTGKSNGSVGNGETPEWFKLPPSAPVFSEGE